MPTFRLPGNPSLEHLRNQARELQRRVRRGDPEALALAAKYRAEPSPTFALTAAQTLLARLYGFPAWTRLRRHVEVISERNWNPAPPPPDESTADRILRLACLTYHEDRPERWAEAALALAAVPRLTETDLAIGVVAGDYTHVQDLVRADPSAAVRPGGPFGWSPLMYLTYSRLPVDARSIRATLRLLLAAGADPNDGRFFGGEPTPFTVLTGLFGSNSTEQPAHPHAPALARVLLDAGADPNDGQTLYNRMFTPEDDHLELLFEYGLGTGAGGPWHRRLGDQLEPPSVMLSALLEWAVSHDQRDRVALLAAHGVDVVGPFTASRRSTDGGLTPIDAAVRNGNLELAAQLRSYGAVESPADPVQEFVAAALAADADRVRATPAAVVAAAREQRPGLIVWAAGLGRTSAVELLVEQGFDVNALGRSDTPLEQPWQTALHAAAGDGALELARRLLELGADPTRLDRRFDATPLGWARHLGQDEMVALLEPLTPE
jgi:ankyrin repeat protein